MTFYNFMVIFQNKNYSSVANLVKYNELSQILYL